jgi:hypothetical protein
MTTMKRTFAKGLLPALLLSAALCVPAESVAVPSPNGKAHAADKANKDHKNRGDRNKGKKAEQQRQQQERQHLRHQKQLQQQERKRLQQQSKIQQQQLKQQRFEVQRQAKLRHQAQLQRQAELRHQAQFQRQAELQRQLQLQRQAELRRQAELQRRANRDRLVYRAPAPVYRQPIRNAQPVRPWDGWNRRYGRFGSGNFQLDGTFVDQQYGCALVQDHQGQVIPLVSNPGDLRRGDHLLLSGRIENSTVCGTAFRVFSVDRIWADARHRNVLFDRRNDGDYLGTNRDRFDRYDPYDDRDNRDLISVDGRLDRGMFCNSIEADNGDRFSLSGDLGSYRDGDYVRVIGFREGRSLCGGETIEIQEITG